MEMPAHAPGAGATRNTEKKEREGEKGLATKGTVRRRINRFLSNTHSLFRSSRADIW